MIGAKMLQVLVLVVMAVTRGSATTAENLSVRVVDPQQRLIVGAHVTLTCGNEVIYGATDGQGSFSFAGSAVAETCKVRVFQSGFDPLELTVGQRRTLTLQLRIAEVKQTVNAKDDRLSPGSLASLSLSASDLKRISDNSDVLIAYAKQLAGIAGGSDQLYADGLPIEHPPPADRIESITINPDPFSAEYSDGGNPHIDIRTKPAERKFRLSTGGFSLGAGERDGLNPHLASATRTSSIGLTAPVPYIPIAFTTDTYFTERRAEVPIDAALPFGFSTNVDSAPARALRGAVTLGSDYSRGNTLNVNTSLYLWTVKQTNAGVSGLTLPEAGFSQGASAHEFRATYNKSGPYFLYRGGLVADWFVDDMKANSSALGISVSGAFITGGASIKQEINSGARWTFKNVLQVSKDKRYWSIGATISRNADSQSITPNPAGQIQFDNLQAYIMSATTGAHSGVGFITRGQSNVQYASYTAAPFVEAELVRRSWLSLRGGLRAEYQTAGGLLASPRISAVANLHGLTLRIGSGIFVHDWSNDIFLKMVEGDGHHLQQFLIRNASLTDMENGATTIVPQIVSRTAPNLTRPREWISKASIEKDFGLFVPGIEYTSTASSRLLGSERLGGVTGWTDLLESNRTLHKQQLHCRAQYKVGSQSLTAHYTWIRSFDDTDGPFSFPATPGDLRDEWARSSGVSPHNLSLVGNFQIRGGVSLTVADAWRSSAPYNITTGMDPMRNGLYNDRGGMARNSGVGPSYSDLSLFVFRRFRVLRLAKQSERSLYVNFGIQAENLLGARNYLTLNPVRDSPIFGQPLSALSGRSLRFSVNLSQ